MDCQRRTYRVTLHVQLYRSYPSSRVLHGTSLTFHLTSPLCANLIELTSRRPRQLWQPLILGVGYLFGSARFPRVRLIHVPPPVCAPLTLLQENRLEDRTPSHVAAQKPTEAKLSARHNRTGFHLSDALLGRFFRSNVVVESSRNRAFSSRLNKWFLHELQVSGGPP